MARRTGGRHGDEIQPNWMRANIIVANHNSNRFWYFFYYRYHTKNGYFRWNKFVITKNHKMFGLICNIISIISIRLKLWVATARHNFVLVEISITTNHDNLVGCMVEHTILPLQRWIIFVWNMETKWFFFQFENISNVSVRPEQINFVDDGFAAPILPWLIFFTKNHFAALFFWKY